MNVEKKIDSNDFVLKIGTTNKVTPKVIYIMGKGFVIPKADSKTYEKDFSTIKENFKKNISSYLNSKHMFDKNYVLSFQIASSRMKPLKKSFLEFQLYLKQNEPYNKDFASVKNIIESDARFLSNDLAYNIKSYGFGITKTKK